MYDLEYGCGRFLVLLFRVGNIFCEALRTLRLLSMKELELLLDYFDYDLINC
jgi:hypothetical protein